MFNLLKTLAPSIKYCRASKGENDPTCSQLSKRDIGKVVNGVPELVHQVGYILIQKCIKVGYISLQCGF